VKENIQNNKRIRLEMYMYVVNDVVMFVLNIEKHLRLDSRIDE